MLAHARKRHISLHLHFGALTEGIRKRNAPFLSLSLCVFVCAVCHRLQASQRAWTMWEEEEVEEEEYGGGMPMPMDVVNDNDNDTREASVEAAE